MSEGRRDDRRGRGLSDREQPPRGPVDATQIPRFAGPATFARLPRRDEVERCDIAIVGVPFDAGTTYRPGARFGPGAIRAGSKLLRPYHPGLDLEPFGVQQVADAGDIACNPFDIAEAITTIERGATELLARRREAPHDRRRPHDRAAAPARDPREVRRGRAGALRRPSRHLGHVLRRAVHTRHPVPTGGRGGAFVSDRSAHVGIRGPLYAKTDLSSDEALGFTIVSSADYARISIDDIAARLRARVGDAPVYVSIDVDVMDPAHAPGTGTPEAGGLTSRELLLTLRALDGLPIVGADVVEVAPAYDHAELTTIAASHVVYELLGPDGTEGHLIMGLAELSGRVTSREVICRARWSTRPSAGSRCSILSACGGGPAGGGPRRGRGAGRRVARGAAPGPLAGLPVLVKDVTDVAGMRTTFGSRLYADAPAADRGRAGAGAAPRRRRDRGGQDQHARVRRRGLHGEPLVRGHGQPLEPRRHARGLERRLGGGAGRGHGSDRHGGRRRRLGPDPRRLVRAGRAETHQRRDRARPGPGLDRLLHRRADGHVGGRRTSAARRHGRARWAATRTRSPAAADRGPAARPHVLDRSVGRRGDRCLPRWPRRSSAPLARAGACSVVGIEPVDATELFGDGQPGRGLVHDRGSRACSSAGPSDDRVARGRDGPGHPRVLGGRAGRAGRGVPRRPPPTVRVRPRA